MSDLMHSTKIAVFKGKQVRKTIHNNEWWFAVEDVVLALIDSNDPKQYIQRMKQRDPELKKGWVQFVHTLFIDTEGGKQKMNCANTEGVFRIIQSIPSPKAEPFKRWLAPQPQKSSAAVTREDLSRTSNRPLTAARSRETPEKSWSTKAARRSSAGKIISRTRRIKSWLKNPAFSGNVFEKICLVNLTEASG